MDSFVGCMSGAAAACSSPNNITVNNNNDTNSHVDGENHISMNYVTMRHENGVI